MSRTGANARRPRLLFAILAHADEQSLRELVHNTRTYCPDADLVLYNSGSDPTFGADIHKPPLERFPSPVPLEYSKVTQFFFDVFDWLVRTGRDFDYIVNIETDMLFLRHGFADFLGRVMDGYDYMAPLFSRHTPKASRWRPIRTLRPELLRWYEVFGFKHTHRGFSPGQVFSRHYVNELVTHPAYRELKELTKENRSNSLQEVLFPTLVDLLDVAGRSYPEELAQVNRYRPYQGVSGVRRALRLNDAYFVHPVRRDPDNPARRQILELTALAAGNDGSGGASC